MISCVICCGIIRGISWGLVEGVGLRLIVVFFVELVVLLVVD